ncbi:prolyl oligopeptidase family serine peptidase [Roseiconus nitratireducens]|uniref:Prolyl oligopeptidase family serine peptidase n=1 Tax=Roseiconus nitratireducens TaxID=2605748 RepID=A0A5M6DFF4_9BACT|nr:prolyl oligopeptidase family serine peptidase [Roseiconus nitratireducens]
MHAADSPDNGETDRPKQRSRTINQRLAPDWIDDHHFTFRREDSDGDIDTVLVDALSGEMSVQNDPENDESNAGLSGGPPPRSQNSSDHTEIEFINQADQPVEILWVEDSGRPRGYGELAVGQTRRQHTFVGHAWMVRGRDGTYYGSLVANALGNTARIEKAFDAPPERRTPRRRWSNRRRDGSGRSPDGSRELRATDSGLQIRTLESDDAWRDLPVGPLDGAELRSPQWSPDGKVVAVWKVDEHPAEEVFTIESSPDEGGRAVLHRHDYRLPGDPMDEHHLLVFDAETENPLAVDLPVFDFGRPRIHWFDGHKMAIEKVDRGHGRFRLFVVDPIQGEWFNAIDERPDTFVWTQHGPPVSPVTYLQDSDRVIYSSEKSGYRHLYLVDLAAQSPMTPITQGDWLVREIVEIDESNQTVDLLVGEYFDDQDPYHRHLVRASLQGGDVVPITEGDGDHEVQFSPDRQYVVVTYSRADAPPVHELRRTTDGSLVTELMRAERINDSDAGDWELPRVFHAAGRDGSTEIWGLIHFPEDFDPSLADHYPIIEAIYAGPHGSHVPKRYRHGRSYEDLTSMGFVVVQIDGMGTANRSKAFHDVCWQNLKDAGFPDRVAWIKAAAEKYPALDPSRVGVFGTSAGGQNACGALLFHGDFYKAAVASCGCHDNRMDKASWNEQWMGYPVDQHYSDSSNIDNAHRLQGDLFLIVGELDENVPPESTYRLVDALIDHRKRFDFLMVPGMGHSDGGTYGRDRMREFFRRTLKP